MWGVARVSVFRPPIIKGINDKIELNDDEIDLHINIAAPKKKCAATTPAPILGGSSVNDMIVT